MFRSTTLRSILAAFTFCLVGCVLSVGPLASAGEGIPTITSGIQSVLKQIPVKPASHSQSLIRVAPLQVDDQVLRQLDFVRTIA